MVVTSHNSVNALDMLMIMHNLCALGSSGPNGTRGFMGAIFYTCCQWTVNWWTFTPSVTTGPDARFFPFVSLGNICLSPQHNRLISCPMCDVRFLFVSQKIFLSSIDFVCSKYFCIVMEMINRLCVCITFVAVVFQISSPGIDYFFKD